MCCLWSLCTVLLLRRVDREGHVTSQGENVCLPARPDFHCPETENSNRPPDVDTTAHQGPPYAPCWLAAAQLMSPSPFMLADGK